MTSHIPRITVEAWTRSESVTAALRAAYANRHMIRAKSTDLHEGGPEDAYQYYVDRGTPDLLILEIDLDEAGTRAFLERFEEKCAPRTRVVLIGRVNDVHFYKAMISQGISEYLLMPVDENRLIDTFGKIYHSNQHDSAGRLSYFIGASGGVGTSTVALNTAYAAAEKLDTPTLLVDMDTGFGSVQLNLNSSEGGQDLGTALFNERNIDEGLIAQLIQRVTNRLDVLLSPSTLDRNLDLSQETVDKVMDALRNTAPNTMIDMPRVWTQWARSSLALASDIVIVTQPDMAGLRNTKMMYQALQNMRRDASLPHYVINQAGRVKRSEIATTHFYEAIGVQPLAVIPDDPKAFSAAANEGKTVVQNDSSSQATAMFCEIASALSGGSRSGMSSKVQTKTRIPSGMGAGLAGLLSRGKKKAAQSPA